MNDISIICLSFNGDLCQFYVLPIVNSGDKHDMHCLYFLKVDSRNEETPV